MLRITADETSDIIRLRLDGKLSGAWVSELEEAYSTRKEHSGCRSIVLDLENLTGADAAGRYLLALIHREGVTLENVNPLSVTRPLPLDCPATPGEGSR